MGITKRMWQKFLENKEWHYSHCTIEQENDRDSGTTVWCVEHEVDVTKCLPDYEPEWEDREEVKILNSKLNKE